MKNPFLTGEKIYLSPLTVEDISEEYISWLNDGEVCSENSHAVYPNTYESTLAYVGSAGKNRSEIVFAIKWKKNNEHVGNISVQKIDPVNRSAEIAIIIGNKKYWNKGIGSEAYELVIKYGFNTLNLNRISSGQTTSNKGMINVCEKNGMKKEGILREVLFKNGKYADAVIYSILAKDFSKKK
ncbi:MAG TPA: GNAT family protein [Ignavibacteria bacterium]|nr:GNAT family protein [Ignavibacteria bacterium]HMR38845.1 GNAT family protein [Ignavibacteria bacterium]